MKRLAFGLLAAYGLTLFSGCGEVKRKTEQVIDGAARHAIDTAADKGNDATNRVIDGAADAATKQKDSDDAKKRDALKGSKDDPDN
jgi:hypothetical protein